MTPKQSRFVAEYLIDLNATQAAIRAGYSADTAGPGAAQVLKNIKVRAAIDAALAKRSGKLEITAEKVIGYLEDARRQAMDTLEWGSAIRASELLGKHIGMFGDRVTINDERFVMRGPDKAADADDWLAKSRPH